MDVYAGVSRLPSLLISARSSKPRLCGGGPSSCNACSRSWALESPEESDRVQRIGGEGSKVCEMVVVAVTTLPLRAKASGGP